MASVQIVPAHAHQGGRQQGTTKGLGSLPSQREKPSLAQGRARTTSTDGSILSLPPSITAPLRRVVFTCHPAQVGSDGLQCVTQGTAGAHGAGSVYPTGDLDNSKLLLAASDLANFSDSKNCFGFGQLRRDLESCGGGQGDGRGHDSIGSDLTPSLSQAWHPLRT